jgi:hypothetical protein
MKCELCKKDVKPIRRYVEVGFTEIYFTDRCPECLFDNNMVKAVDPAELLRLANKVRFYPAILITTGENRPLEAVIAHLSGDPKPLKKLAGEEQVQCPQCTGHKKEHQDTCNACAEEDSE